MRRKSGHDIEKDEENRIRRRRAWSPRVSAVGQARGLGSDRRTAVRCRAGDRGAVSPAQANKVSMKAPERREARLDIYNATSEVYYCTYKTTAEIGSRR